MSPLANPKVIIFSDHLLYPSDAFIHAQSSAMSQFEPAYAGSRRVADLDLLGARIYVINHGNNLGEVSRTLLYT
jgi:hypothetical protein